jgi:hypothetical protein
VSHTTLFFTKLNVKIHQWSLSHAFSCSPYSCIAITVLFNDVLLQIIFPHDSASPEIIIPVPINFCSSFVATSAISSNHSLHFFQKITNCSHPFVTFKHKHFLTFLCLAFWYLLHCYQSRRENNWIISCHTHFFFKQLTYIPPNHDISFFYLIVAHLFQR